MQVLKTVRWSLKLLGYFASNRNTFSKQQVKIIVAGIVCVPLLREHFLSEVVNTQNYLSSIFLSTVTVLIFISFVDTLQKTEKIFLSIDLYEKIFNEST